MKIPGLKVDYLIIGQGLAGTVLALKLLKKKKKIFVLDDPSLSSCSRIASGVINPVVFKRLNRSWMVDEALPAAETFYRSMEKELGIRFYHKKEIVKFFTEDQEKQLWRKKAEEEMREYLSPDIQEGVFSEGVKKENGYSLVKHAAYVETAKFLEHSKKNLLGRHLLREEIFEHDKIIFLKNEKLSYKEITADTIIFCEGHRVTTNPWFSWLPMAPAKGELLRIQVPGLELKDKILVKGISLVPCGGDEYTAGSTFSWDDLNDQPTQEAKDELIRKLDELIRLPYTVIEHKAGVRPSVNHRRPLLGHHPQHKQLAVFNGLGTKGLLLAPFCAGRLIRLLEGETIEEEFNILPYFTALS